jgi:hypothetical protein
MTDAQLMACPACAAAPTVAPAPRAPAPAALRRFDLSLPAIHCGQKETSVWNPEPD